METSLADTLISRFQNCYMDRKITWLLIKSCRNRRKALSTLTEKFGSRIQWTSFNIKYVLLLFRLLFWLLSTLFLLLLLLLLFCYCFVFQLSNTTFPRTNARLQKVVKCANSHLSSQHREDWSKKIVIGSRQPGPHKRVLKKAKLS